MTSKSTKIPRTSLVKKISKFVPLSSLTWIYTRILAKTQIRKLVDAYIASRIPPELIIPEGTLILNQKDAAVSGMIAMGLYEPYETALFRETLKPGMNVVDIGANIGFYSVIAASHIIPTGTLFSFEPEQTNFDFLEANCFRNNFKNVHRYQKALSDKTGISTLYITKENTGAYSLVNNRNSHESTTVAVSTLDDILDSKGAPNIDLIKMDIEGGEFNAVKGMKKTIDRSPNLTLFMEFYPNAIRRFGNDPQQFLQTLLEMGLKLFIIDEDTKSLRPIADIGSFLGDFPKGETAKNILATKKPELFSI